MLFYSVYLHRESNPVTRCVIAVMKQSSGASCYIIGEMTHIGINDHSIVCWSVIGSLDTNYGGVVAYRAIMAWLWGDKFPLKWQNTLIFSNGECRGGEMKANNCMAVACCDVRRGSQHGMVIAGDKVAREIWRLYDAIISGWLSR